MTDTSEQTVCIFHGDGAKFASAVFATEDDALSWAARHRVSGIVLADAPWSSVSSTTWLRADWRRRRWDRVNSGDRAQLFRVGDVAADGVEHGMR
jgi:hypothetical protein